MAVVDPLIELRGVKKHFGTLHVLRDIEFTVGRGEAVVGVGPSRPPTRWACARRRS